MWKYLDVSIVTDYLRAMTWLQKVNALIVAVEESVVLNRLGWRVYG